MWNRLFERNIINYILIVVFIFFLIYIICFNEENIIKVNPYKCVKNILISASKDFTSVFILRRNNVRKNKIFIK